MRGRIFLQRSRPSNFATPTLYPRYFTPRTNLFCAFIVDLTTSRRFSLRANPVHIPDVPGFDRDFAIPLVMSYRSSLFIPRDCVARVDDSGLWQCDGTKLRYTGVSRAIS